MTIGLIGKKLGMTHVYDEKGSLIPVTLVQAGPCPVIMKKNRESDGYDAIQVGYEAIAEKRATKPMSGHFKKHDAKPHRYVREFRLENGDSPYEVGQVLDVELFEAGDTVDVIGWTKGRGFTGVIKRHHASRGPETHGSNYHRRPGSMGQSSFPSRVFKGKIGAGRVGNQRVTQLNLKIMMCDKEKNLLAIKGSVPGHPNGFIIIRKAIKQRKKNK